MALPPLSVLMPVYNGARYLRPVIDSILGQTWRDFEFLILDDGSTDASFRILQGYAAQDARISVFQRPHRGIAQSRNDLLQRAQGQWIACMDADDISLPERFARQIAFLASHPEVVCVGGAIDWIDARGNWLGHCSMPETDADLQRLMLGGISLLHHPCTMARRSALLQVRGYDETLIASADLDLWLRLGEIGKLANLPDTVLQYRLHRKSITHVQQHQQHQDAFTACQRAWQRRGVPGTFIRQPADHLNQTEFWLRCGWQGFQTGQRDVAKRCGLGAIRTQPLSWTAWNLFLCAWLKPITLQPST